jgi:hypothetical protein
MSGYNKLFIHIRDEEFSFDMLRTGLRGTTPNYVYRIEPAHVSRSL